jgi:hypothetical protein
VNGVKVYKRITIRKRRENSNAKQETKK